MNVVLTPATIAKLELNPGDVVIVKVNDNLTRERTQQIADTVNEVLPNHKVIVLARNLSIEVVAKGRESNV